MLRRYSEYFDQNSSFYTVITSELIKNGKISLKDFYPHEMFVRLLEEVHDVISGRAMRSIWLEGPYGSGKTHAALTVKAMLEAPDAEIEDYFAAYGLNKDLCQKLITDKHGGKIIVIHRSGSSTIHSDQDLIWCVQSSISEALKVEGMELKASAVLREAALCWFERKANRDYFNSLILEDPRNFLPFGGSGVDDIIAQLREGDTEHVFRVMKVLSKVAKENGIILFQMDMVQLTSWITEVISVNNLKGIFFIWDEFTEFFRNNVNELSGFQSLAELSFSSSFYFMLVTHELQGLSLDSKAIKKIGDRFRSVRLELPDNTALRLMVQAMKLTRAEVLRKDWEEYKTEINSSLALARSVICGNITSPSTPSVITDAINQDLQNIIPIHPYTAITLKYLSVALGSNQRSMFEFIVSQDLDLHGFRWFIENYGPLDEDRLLTVDMLWDFLYSRENVNLKENVRMILDSFKLLKADELPADAQRVIKVILIFNAVSLGMGKVDLIRADAQNLNLVFAGTSWGNNQAVYIANQLLNDGILFLRKLGNGQSEYVIANSSGDFQAIKQKRDEITQNLSAQSLIEQAELSSVFQIPEEISERFIIGASSLQFLNAAVKKIKSMYKSERFYVIAAFVIFEEEAGNLEAKLKDYIAGDDLIIIDASATPLGRELLNHYIEDMACSKYYSQIDSERAAQFQKRALKHLAEWKENILNGTSRIFTNEQPAGILCPNLYQLQLVLSSMNYNRYPYGLENYKVNASMFSRRSRQFSLGARCGINQELTGQFNAPNESNKISHVLADVWQVSNYWENPENYNLPIVRMKLEAEAKINECLNGYAGRVSLWEIFSLLRVPPFGLMPNNFAAFVLGFIMKEYVNEKYFWSDGSITEEMTQDRMAGMIVNVLTYELNPSRVFREEFITVMSAEQEAFLKFAVDVFGVPLSGFRSIEEVCQKVQSAVRSFKFPLWPLKKVIPILAPSCDEEKLTSVINMLSGSALKVSIPQIGKLLIADPGIAADAKKVLSAENCRSGFEKYFEEFHGQELQELALKIGRKKFNLEEFKFAKAPDDLKARIEDLILEYKIIIESNRTLRNCTSMQEVLSGWQKVTNKFLVPFAFINNKGLGKNLGIEALPFIEYLYDVNGSNNLPREDRQKFLELLKTMQEPLQDFIASQFNIFMEIAEPVLEGLNEYEAGEIFKLIPPGQFMKSSGEFISFVSLEVRKFKAANLREKLRSLWAEKTGTKNPEDWSARYQTPILCMFEDAELPRMKQIFKILANPSPSEADAEHAINFLSQANFYGRLQDEKIRDECFMRGIVRDYALLLNEPERVRDFLASVTNESVYDWFDNSSIQRKLKLLADEEYKSKGSKEVCGIVDEININILRDYIKNLIRANINIGLEILKMQKEE